MDTMFKRNDLGDFFCHGCLYQIFMQLLPVCGSVSYLFFKIGFSIVRHQFFNVKSLKFNLCLRRLPKQISLSNSLDKES